MRGWHTDVDRATYECPFCSLGHAISFQRRGTSPRIWAVCRVCGQFEETLLRQVGGQERAWSELWREWIGLLLAACREASYIPMGCFSSVALHQLEIDNHVLFTEEAERAYNVLEYAQTLWPDQLED